MARSIETIISEMDVAQASEASLSTLNSPSQTAIYTLWKSITSTVINYLEQLWDIYKIDIETVISNGAIGSAGWLQQQILKFQYSTITPQIVTLVNFSPSYPIVDTTLRLISRSSVKTMANKTISVKVAKSEPPVALSVLELNSLKGYLSDIGFAGTQTNTFSYDSDKYYLQANIYYNGQYASVISATVIAAIENYFANIPFDGIIKLLTLEDYIQNVPGVTDVVIVNAAIRADTTAFASKTYMVSASTTIYPTYPTFAGYVVGETTVSNTLADTLTFISQ
jgi:hypothetical protein